MKLVAFLPPSRYEAGTIHVIDGAGTIVVGPYRARGEADNTWAAKAGNEREDPTQPYGDHPDGLYRVEQLVDVEPAKLDTYGPHFLRLEPLDGQALQAKLNGRTGLGIHAGKEHADGRLRETFGCLRVDERTLMTLADLVRERFAAGRVVLYECRVIQEAP